MSLATFIQISDLHIGVVDPNTSNARTKAWMRCPHLDGLLGHSGMSLRHLADFMSEFKRKNPKAQLIVTGDLTTRGDQQEYETANEFLSNKLIPPRAPYVGLGVNNWTNRGIPGNHDHWPGINPQPPTNFPMLGLPHLNLAQIFPGLPAIDPTIQLSTGQSLQFLRIDTDVDVDPNNGDRFLARGLFVSHLADLDKKLAKPAPNEIRVLCLHHSRQYEPKTRLFPILEIDRASRIALDAFLSKHRISILLCGHIHRPPGLDVFRLTRGIIFSWDVLEVRCGTTTQFDLSLDPKPAFLTFSLFLKPHWPNTLVVHEVLQEGQKIIWRAELYLEDPEDGFQPAPQGVWNGVPTTVSFRVRL
jgi:Calcineurin-like phosphoesterase